MRKFSNIYFEIDVVFATESFTENRFLLGTKNLAHYYRLKALLRASNTQKERGFALYEQIDLKAISPVQRFVC